MSLGLSTRVGALIVAAGIALGAQQGAPQKLAPGNQVSNARFHNATLKDALTLVGQQCGIAIQFADDVPDLQKIRPINAEFRNLTFEDAVRLLLSSAALTYTVVDAKTIRVEKKP
jgi:hypothetical protein